MANDSADVTSSGRSFKVCGPATGKARLPTVDSLLVGTTRRLVPTERSDRRLGSYVGDTCESFSDCCTPVAPVADQHCSI